MLEPDQEQQGIKQEDLVADVTSRIIQLINDNFIEEAARTLQYNYNYVNDILQDSKLQDALKEYAERTLSSEEESPVYPTEDDFTPESLETRRRIDLILRGQYEENIENSEITSYEREGLDPFLRSQENVRTFVDGMKEFIAHNRSILKAKYLYDPDNKQVPLPDADKILNNLIILLQKESPEYIIDVLRYFYPNRSYSNSSSMYVLRDPESAVAGLISCYKKIVRLSNDDFWNENDKFRDLFYYYGQGEEFDKLYDLVQHCAGLEVAICTHIFPDSDAYGSQIALGLLMEKFGAKVSLYNHSANNTVSHDEVMMQLGMKDSSGRDLVKISSKCPEDKHFDIVIILDSDRKRVGDALPKDASMYYRIDHHKFANFEQAVAICEVIGYLYEKLNQDDDFKNLPHFESSILLDQSLKIESLIPTLLYIGCFTDSGNFSRLSANFDILKDKFELMNSFLSSEVASNLIDYATPPKYTQKFASYLLDHERVVILNNGIGIIIFDEVDSRLYPIMNKKKVWASQVGLNKNNIKIFPPENGQTCYSLGLRSSGNRYYCALDVAEVFGGGGHENAAGCSIEQEKLLDIEYVKNIVRKLTGREFNNPILEEYLISISSAERDADVREALKNIAIARGDCLEALKLSCPSFSLLDVGGIYVNKYVAALALILEEIPCDFCEDYYDYDVYI